MNTNKLGIIITAFIGLFLIAVLTEPLWKKQQQPSLATLGGSFSLQSVQGSVTLSDFQDNVVILYFGYTQCSDVCPLSLAILGQAIRQLSSEQQQQVQGIFISVDPERDSLEHLQTYSAFFSDRIIGATGKKNEIDRIVKQYGAFYRFVEIPGSAMGYSVDHSALLYLIDRQGNLIKTVPHNINVDILATEISALL